MSQYYNEQFRTAKLNHFGNQIKFWLPSNRNAGELV